MFYAEHHPSSTATIQKTLEAKKLFLLFTHTQPNGLNQTVKLGFFHLPLCLNLKA
jgi:hypothetical protein